MAVFVAGPVPLSGIPAKLAAVHPAGAGMAQIHRVTDYGTHAIVDIDLPDAVRLKAMVPEARNWTAGQKVDLRPRAFAAYRGNEAIFRSVDAND